MSKKYSTETIHPASLCNTLQKYDSSLVHPAALQNIKQKDKYYIKYIKYKSKYLNKI